MYRMASTHTAVVCMPLFYTRAGTALCRCTLVFLHVGRRANKHWLEHYIPTEVDSMTRLGIIAEHQSETGVDNDSLMHRFACFQNILKTMCQYTSTLA